MFFRRLLCEKGLSTCVSIMRFHTLPSFLFHTITMTAGTLDAHFSTQGKPVRFPAD